jgi:hypothetical protein
MTLRLGTWLLLALALLVGGIIAGAAYRHGVSPLPYLALYAALAGGVYLALLGARATWPDLFEREDEHA